MGLATAHHQHQKHCSLWPDSRGSTVWSDVSIPGMLLHLCHHKPPPSPVEGVCVGGVVDDSPSNAIPKNALQLDRGMESMVAGEVAKHCG